MDGSNIDTTLLLTVDYLDSGSMAQSMNSVDNPLLVFWEIYTGKSKLYFLASAKDGTVITITIDGYRELNITASEGGIVARDYYLENTGEMDITPPKITISSPENITYYSTLINLNVSTDETIDTLWHNLNFGRNSTLSLDMTLTGTEGLNYLVIYANDSAGNTGFKTVWFTIKIKATVDIIPDTFRLWAGGKWVISYIELPPGYTASDINLSTVRLNDTIAAETGTEKPKDHDGIMRLRVRFDRSALKGLLDGKSGEVELTVKGKLKDGSPFEGSDIIKLKISNPGILGAQ